jgi:uncharacterized Fe-S center protein
MSHEAVFVQSDGALVAFLTERLGDVFAPRDRVAIKLHMGEPGNTFYIAAPLAKRIVDCLVSVGARPFIFDSPVTYRSPRGDPKGYLAAAASHGYTADALGCPVVVSDASVSAKGSRMTYRLSADPIKADGVLLLTHVKGHVACGMGGAVKNVGMGCMAKETKAAIHSGGEPSYAGEGCTQCGECVSHCPTGNITIETGGPCFGATWCPGCSNCVLACPSHCITPRVAPFDELLAEGAVLAHERFKKRFAVNVLRNIATHCDCMPDAGPLLAEDIGFVCADDMVTADAASLELLAARTGRADLFAERHRHSPWEHVRAAARFMGRDTAVTLRTV